MTTSVDSLEGLLIQLEENLQRRRNTGGLDLAPEAAFVTADAVHYTRDVPEVGFELFFEDLDHTQKSAVTQEHGYPH